MMTYQICSIVKTQDALHVYVPMCVYVSEVGNENVIRILSCSLAIAQTQIITWY